MEARPYRSHKIRACDACRKQKVGCVVEIPGNACRRCHLRGEQCIHASTNTQSASSDEASVRTTRPTEMLSTPALETRIPKSWPRLHSGVFAHPQSAVSPLPNDRSPDQVSVVPSILSPTTPTVHILGPSGAQDSQVIEQHLAPGATSPTARERIGICSTDQRKPVGFASLLSSQDTVIHDPFSASVSRRKVLEQIVSPFAETLIRLYVDKINTAFPIIDKGVLLASVDKEQQQFADASDALLCAVYASAMLYWNCSSALTNFPCPDTTFVHGLTTGAMQDDSSKVRLSSLAASLVFLTKRPVLSITDNSMNLGRAVSLAHCLGLNRDSSTWSIAESEKDLRNSLWWSLLVHDTWLALARGTPPLITASQFDVSLPTVQTLNRDGQKDARETLSADSFILLCRLTIIAQSLLGIAFNLQITNTNVIIKGLRQCQVDLDKWEDLLLQWKSQCTLNGAVQVPGTSNLLLCFLTLKMLIHRMALHESSKTGENQPDAARSFNQMNCRTSAREIVDFVTELDQYDFTDFWLPYSASHFTVCATLLLRCAVEADNSDERESCMADLQKLQIALQSAHEGYDWELGEACIARCEALIPRVQNANTELYGSGNQGGAWGSLLDFDMNVEQGNMTLFDAEFWLNSVSMEDLLPHPNVS